MRRMLQLRKLTPQNVRAAKAESTVVGLNPLGPKVWSRDR